MVHLLSWYSEAYANNQFRAMQQFFRWLADEEDLPDPMARLRAPKVTEKLVPVFTSGELPALEKTCQGRSFVQRRDAAIIAVLIATGIRAGELAGIAMTQATRAAAISTCGAGRSRCAAKAAGRGSCGSGTTRPGPWPGTSASGPVTPRRGGRSCGWA
jgi:site-specific recombinase XerD